MILNLHRRLKGQEILEENKVFFGGREVNKQMICSTKPQNRLKKTNDMQYKAQKQTQKTNDIQGPETDSCVWKFDI